MDKFLFTEYFEKEVLRKRQYLTKAMCIRVVENPIRTRRQDNNRYRFWGRPRELDGQVLRVVTLSDKMTIHNAFIDRGYQT